MIGRRYVDPGDRWAGRYDPPRPCVVLVAGRASTQRAKAGPRTVLVEYLDDGSRAVVPFSRRLRRAGAVTDTERETYTAADGEQDVLPVEHECADGWLGEDGDGRPRPCPVCRPHVARGRRRLRDRLEGRAR